jgi:hypothetical protein
MLPFMHTTPLALLAAAGTATALPTTEYASATAGEQHRNARRSGCHSDEIQIVREGDKLICQGKTHYWQEVTFKYVAGSVLVGAATTIAYWVTSKWNVQSLSVGARMVRRDGDDDDTIYIVADDNEEVAVTATIVNDRRVVRIEDWLASTRGGDLVARSLDSDATAAPLIGGEVHYHLNGTLDTFTLDFAASPETNNSLAARGAWTVHTTYWATPGHASTSLGYDAVKNLALESYTHLLDGTSQACGYMANSGTWHGAFRHWLGDNGYTIGECDADRKF